MYDEHAAALSLADLSRYDRLRDMLATGIGINRNPHKPIRVQDIKPRYCDRTRLLVHVDDIWGDLLDQDVQIDDRIEADLYARRSTRPDDLPRLVVYPDVPSVPYEFDVAHYRRVQRERVAIEDQVRRTLVQGHTIPEPVHTPLFGHDRFRRFDPCPAFETVIGPICFVNR